MNMGDQHDITIKKEKIYSRWYFIQKGNRYPAAPNVPVTWQEWKKLEDSSVPSTMRDEIRLTRILIQYCDTEDAKVLTEVEQWFAGLNEVQRTVMARRVARCAVQSVDILIQSNPPVAVRKYLPVWDIYHAIRKYDDSLIDPSQLQLLRGSGLIE